MLASLKPLLPPRSKWKAILLFVPFQFAMGYVPLFFQSQYNTYALSFWPASGTALAAVLLGGPWMLLGTFLGLGLNGVIFHNEQGAFFLFLMCSANVAEAWVAWLLLKKLAPDFRTNLSRIRDLGLFLALAPWIPALVSSGITQLILAQLNGPNRNLSEEFFIYALGNASGIILVTPCILVWQDVRKFDWRSIRGASVLGLVTVLLVSLFFFKYRLHPVVGTLLASLLLPFALWGVWQTGLRGSSIMILTASLVFFAFDSRAREPMAVFILHKLQGLDPTQPSVHPEHSNHGYIYSIAAQLGFLGLMAGTILPIGAVADELRKKIQAQDLAMKSLQAIFWTWDEKGGLSLEREKAFAFADIIPPNKLFDPKKPMGRKLLKLDSGSKPDFCSYWAYSATDKIGRPSAVVGVLQDLTLQHERDRAMQKADALDLEVQVLRSHLNPHLLFNCLTGLRGLIAADPAQAKEFTGQLAKFLRQVLEHQQSKVVPVSSEIELCRSYAFIQNVRGQKLDLITKVDRRAMHAKIAPLTLVTLLENASKHGLAPDSGRLEVVLESSWDKQGNLKLKMRNPGEISSTKRNQRGDSGLALIRRQLAKISPRSTSIELRQKTAKTVEAVLSMKAG